MKIFISHSSADKWAARRISAELENLGIKTFLDEKDITTGESINDSIQKHLRECDDFLILLSPASIGSHWVLIELGGALALDKKLVPILLYLGTNDIPKPITKHLARDVNEIDKYYEEVKIRIKHPKIVNIPKIEPEVIAQPAQTTVFAVGDIVTLPPIPQTGIYRKNKKIINWKEEMNSFCGKKGKILAIDDDDSVNLDVDGGKYWYAFEWLTKE